MARYGELEEEWGPLISTSLLLVTHAQSKNTRKEIPSTLLGALGYDSNAIEAGL